MSDPNAGEDLPDRGGVKDQGDLVDLFARNRERLRRMVQVRLDHRLQGRIDPSDVLQEAHLDVHHRAGEYLADPTMPPFLWLRFLTNQRLLALHRKHLGARMRDAGREIAPGGGRVPRASSVSLAAMLLGHLTSPTQAARRAEMQARLQEALDILEPLDREVLALRHFEELSNAEVAASLNLSKQAASNRYMRALKRLKEILASMPDLFDP